MVSTYHLWQQTPSPSERAGARYENIPEFCYAASLDEVAKKDFSLVPSKYIEFVNRDENIDFAEKMQSLKTEFADLLKAESQSKSGIWRVGL